MARDDERLLALADLWSMKALAALGSDEAFVNEELEITAKEFGTTGIHHSATGVYLTDALIAHARGDMMSRSAAIDGFLSIATGAGPERDVSFGRSGILLGIAMLVDALEDSEPSRAALVALGDRLASGLWDELASMPELRAADSSTPAPSATSEPLMAGPGSRTHSCAGRRRQTARRHRLQVGSQRSGAGCTGPCRGSRLASPEVGPPDERVPGLDVVQRRCRHGPAVDARGTGSWR